MKYYVIAKREDTHVLDLFGPWTEIEKADDKIAELEYGFLYSEIELGRVLQDEDRPDQDQWLECDQHEPE